MSEAFDLYLIGGRKGFYVGMAKTAVVLNGLGGWRRRVAAHRIQGSRDGSAYAFRLLRDGARSRRVATIRCEVWYAARMENALWEHYRLRGWKPAHPKPRGGAPDWSSPSFRGKHRKSTRLAWKNDPARRTKTRQRMLDGGAAAAGRASRASFRKRDPVGFHKHQSKAARAAGKATQAKKSPEERRLWHRRGGLSQAHGRGFHNAKRVRDCPQCETRS